MWTANVNLRYRNGLPRPAICSTCAGGYVRSTALRGRGYSHAEVGGEPGGHVQRLLEVTYVPGLQGVVTWERRTGGDMGRGSKVKESSGHARAAAAITSTQPRGLITHFLIATTFFDLNCFVLIHCHYSCQVRTPKNPNHPWKERSLFCVPSFMIMGVLPCPIGCLRLGGGRIMWSL